MVRSVRLNYYMEDDKSLEEFYGLSDDTKPTDGIATGSVFFEVDTSAIFIYDEENSTWYEIGAENSDSDIIEETGVE